MKRIKIIKHRVAALFMSLVIALGCTGPAFSIKAKAEALEVMNSACTVADMVLSYCASGGVAVMNTTVIDELYNVLGSSFGTLQTFVDNGLLTYSNGSYVDTGLSTNINSAISNIDSIDIGALFNQTAEQNPSGVALSGASSLAGIAGSVATTGVLPIGIGVAVTGYCGFQIGTIIANMLGLYGDNAGKGFSINADENIVANIPKGYTNTVVTTNNGKTYVYSGNGISIAYISSSYIYYGITNPNSYSINVLYMNFNSSGQIEQNRTYNVTSWNRTTGPVQRTNLKTLKSTYFFNDSQEYSNAEASWRSTGNYKMGNISPDLIGGNGNLNGNYDSQNDKYQFPSVVPNADPSTQSINPTGLSQGDWLNYANAANGNLNSGQPDSNTNIYNDILNDIRINTPTPIPEPEPDPNPDPNPLPDPETVPSPDVNPYPDTYPVADPESVPDNKEQPQYTEKATENETDIVEGDPYTTPDLLNKFPFCIPRDILRAFKKLDSGAREAPHIQWRFNPNEMIDYTFDVDFAMWETIATLLRILELIAFVVALGIATRNLILS